MKTLFLRKSALLCACLLLLSACQKSALQKAIDELNEVCPMQMDAMVVLEKANIAGGQVNFFVTVNPDVINLKALAQNPETLRESILTALSNPQGEMAEFMKEVVAEGKGITYIFQGKKDEKPLEVRTSAKELAAALEETADNSEKLLDLSIENTNVQMPLQIANGITVQKVVKEADAVYYIYELDEDIAPLNRVIERRDEALETAQQAASASAGAEGGFIDVIVATGRGLGYRYKSKQTGKCEDLLIDAATLRQLRGVNTFNVE